MNSLFAVDTSSPAYALGYFLGMLIGCAIFVGFVVFAIIAIVKAFTRKTTAWIVAGSICGFVLAIPVLLVLAGVLAGITSVRQRSSNDVSAAQTNEASPRLVPALTSQTVRGGDLAYTVSLPPGWNFKRHEQDFDILASHGSLYVGVIAEEASLGAPETIAKIARDKLKSLATELRWTDPSTLLLDGRSWLQFVAECKVENIPVTYQFYVYSGAEGTYQLVGWTTHDLYVRDSRLMRDVMRTFRFPQ